MNSLSVYDSLEMKIKNGSTELTYEEREKLREILIDSYVEFITRASDEKLMQEASDRGVIV